MKIFSNLVKLIPDSSCEAAEEFNALIEALAKATPYHKYTGGLSARCIHCGGKLDPTADPLDARKHHIGSCLWLAAWSLVELCK